MRMMYSHNVYLLNPAIVTNFNHPTAEPVFYPSGYDASSAQRRRVWGIPSPGQGQ